jgi:hypothetical protein
MGVSILSPFTLLGALALLYFGVLLLVFLLRNASLEESCTRAEQLIEVLQYAPYQLRATGMESLVPTINSRFDVQATFYETDGRTTNVFRGTVSDDGSTIEGMNLDRLLFFRDWSSTNPGLVLHYFVCLANVALGLTNWIGYRVKLNKPEVFSKSCLTAINQFKFVGDS